MRFAECMDRFWKFWKSGRASETTSLEPCNVPSVFVTPTDITKYDTMQTVSVPAYEETLDITFDYEPLRELSDAELSAARKQDADTHAVYVNAGVIAPDEVRQALAKDEGSPYAGVDLSGPPPDPPQPMMEPDPLGGPQEPGAPPGAMSDDDASGAPDLVAGVARAIEARQADEAYEHWWHGAQ